MTMLTGSASREVDAGIERCWALVGDVARAPQWQAGLTLEVVERDAQDRPLVCDTVSDAKVTKVHCRIEMSYHPPHRLSWARLESDDIDLMEGSWELEALGADLTRATYRLAVDPGPVPLLARPLERALRPLVIGRRPGELAKAIAAGL
jgi:hypothetical protein